MSDFETVPIGTMKELESLRQRLLELDDVCDKLEFRKIHLSGSLAASEERIKGLEADAPELLTILQVYDNGLSNGMIRSVDDASKKKFEAVIQRTMQTLRKLK